MCTTMNNTERAELELRRKIEQARKAVAHYANLNDGGKWGHGAGNFSGSLQRSRGELAGYETALRVLTGN